MRFFYHFNKPLTQRRKDIWWTIHYQNQCVPIKGFECRVATHDRKRKKQPLAVVWGDARSIVIQDNRAIIT
jgi:hypothetical protein